MEICWKGFFSPSSRVNDSPNSSSDMASNPKSVMGSMMSAVSKFVYVVEAIRKQKAGEE